MTSPQTFPIVLLVTCFVVVVAAIVIAVKLESAAFRQRYRVRRGIVPRNQSPRNQSLSAQTALWMRERRLALRPHGTLKLRS